MRKGKKHIIELRVDNIRKTYTITDDDDCDDEDSRCLDDDGRIDDIFCSLENNFDDHLYYWEEVGGG